MRSTSLVTLNHGSSFKIATLFLLTNKGEIWYNRSSKKTQLFLSSWKCLSTTSQLFENWKPNSFHWLLFSENPYPDFTVFDILVVQREVSLKVKTQCSLARFTNPRTILFFSLTMAVVTVHF